MNALRNLILLALAILSTACSQKRFISIGSGGLTGVYYPLAGSMCKLLADYGGGGKIKCTQESTGGSVFNINAVLAGDLDFGIAQSDLQYQAYTGTGEWQAKGPQTNLRSVFNLHPESVTLIASAKSGIRTVKDLRGKRVNLGNIGSGQRNNAVEVLQNHGLDWQRDLRAEEAKASEAAGLLQDGRIDAFFYTVGHPNGGVQEATSGHTPVRFVPITGDSWIANYPYFNAALIPVKHYPHAQNQEDVPTIGVSATLVAAASADADTVYALTKAVVDHLEEFRASLPALEPISRETLLRGLTAPLHPGALKYFREIGLSR